jgi:hypothetical protein
MPRAQTKRKPPWKWQRFTQHALIAKHGDRGVAVTVSPRITGVIAVIAVETAVDGSGSPGAQLNRVLDDHSHAALGTFRSLLRARQAAERYARKWLKQRKAGAALAAACPCEPINLEDPVVIEVEEATVKAEAQAS